MFTRKLIALAVGSTFAFNIKRVVCSLIIKCYFGCISYLVFAILLLPFFFLANANAKVSMKIRIVPELEILTTFLDLTLNFITLIGRPQWNGRFFLAGELVSPAAEI